MGGGKETPTKKGNETSANKLEEWTLMISVGLREGSLQSRRHCLRSVVLHQCTLDSGQS